MSKRLFVGNLSFDISQEQLQEAFAEFGATGATVPTNSHGRPKGFGFVDVAEDQADAAIAAWEGKELDGRALNVSPAKPMPGTEPQHRGFGGRSFGGNRGGGERGGRGGGERGGREGGGQGGGRRW